MTRPRIVCAGIATLDLVYAVDTMPTEAVKYRAKDLVMSGGGLAGNAAVAAARLGAAVSLVTRLGDDLPGDAIIAGLAAEGIDCSAVARVPGGRSPVSSVIVDPAGERMVVSHSDNATLGDAADLPDALLAGADACYAETRWIAAALRLLPQARAAGIPSVLDADRRPSDPAVLDLATHVGFSAPALKELTGIDDVASALAAASTSRANVYLVTDGEKGAWYMEDGRVRHEPAFPVAAVDTLGAGDTWHGALAVALGEHQPLRQAVRFANGAAALKCTVFGGRAGMPHRAALDALLAGS
ncbi:PfkB family carbohydrate kinase [Phreatobacter sp.]|uniref:PfkB family carbohydrate kinase n=1 Tax=Phreatobacter sp. TaxID=1966341 RepID=UPI003F6F8454